eukprot:Nk52_evm16s240 gene=Nk52_evmTU16s240
MSRLKVLNKTANVAWSPSDQDDILLAVGTAAQQLDATFSTSAELAIYGMDMGSQGCDMPLKGSVNADFRFHDIAWGKGLGRGVVAGGMDNGGLVAWKAEDILQGNTKAKVLENQVHKGPVSSLDFNHFQNNLLASSSVNSEIYIWDLQKPQTPMTPGASAQPAADITCVRWNKSVEYILGSTSINGTATVWDLRTSRPVISISDPNNMFRCKCIEWNPDVATLLTTASEDDRVPVIRVWDLRNAYSPVKNLEKHSRGILSMSWCPKDANMLLSCGKDNRTLVWDPESSNPEDELVCELPPNSNSNFDVQWCPRNPSILSTSSFDGTVGVFSLLGSQSAGGEVPANDPFAQINGNAGGATPLKKAPKWLCRPCGVSFGFGGKVVSFGKGSSSVRIGSAVSEKGLVERANKLQSAIDNQNFLGFCDSKIDGIENDKSLSDARRKMETSIWKFLKVNFEEEPRLLFLRLLGYDRDELAETIEKLTLDSKTTATPKKKESKQKKDQDPAAEQPGDSSNSGSNFDSFFKNGDASAETSENVFDSIKPINTVRLSLTPFKISTKDDTNGLLSKALLVGNFEAAVDVCIKEDRIADALLIAIAGGQELLSKTQNIYFERQKSDLSRLISAVVTRNWDDIVDHADIDNWMETLALLCTYAKSDEFSMLCERLGDRLEHASDIANRQNAILCYICAGNMEKMVEYWVKMNAGSSSETNVLSDLIEKVTALRMAMDVDRDLHESSASHSLLSKKYREYASLLASQGCLSTALDCLNLSDSQEFDDQVLRDRLFHANGNPNNLQPPAFPFEAVSAPQAQSTKSYGGSANPSYSSYGQSGNFYQQQSGASQQNGYSYQSNAQPTTVGSTNYVPPPAPSYSQQPQVYGGSSGSGQQSGYSQPGNFSQQPGSFPQPAAPPALPASNTMSANRNQQPQFYQGNFSAPPVPDTKTAAAPPMMNSAPPPPTTGAASPYTPSAQVEADKRWNDPPPITTKKEPKKKSTAYPSAITSPFPNMPSSAPPGPGGMGNAGYNSSYNNAGGQQQYQGQPQGNYAQQGPPPQGGMPGQQAMNGPPQGNARQAPTPPKPASPPPKKPIPAEYKGLVDALNAICEQGKTKSHPACRRMVPETMKRLNTFYDQLRDGSCPPHVISGIKSICSALQAGDFQGAQRMHSELIGQGYIDVIGSYMVGIKNLISIARAT